MTDLLSKALERARNEPVLVTSLVTALLALLVAFKVPINEEQKAAVLLVVGAVMAFVARRKVKPTRSSD